MRFIAFIKENYQLIVVVVFLLSFFIWLIGSVISDSNHIYDRVIVQIPDGTITEVENVKVRDYIDNSWKIICEDESICIMPKENTIISTN